MSRLILLAFIIIGGVAGAYYYLFSGTAVHKLELQHMLDGFTGALQSQDRERIKTELGKMLADNAQVALEVDFPTLPGQKTKNMTAENFSKPDFLTFVDNTLYTLRQYHFAGKVQSLALSKGSTSASFTFSGTGDADGMAMDGHMHFSGDTECEGQAIYPEPHSPVINKLVCVIQLHYGQ